MNSDNLDLAPHAEHILNPAPFSYRVSFFTKSLFLVGAILAWLAYVYMIVDRRLTQTQFLLDNQMAAIQLAPSLLPSFSIYDPIANIDVVLKHDPHQWMLLNLWGSFCTSCREEMPGLELLQQRLSGKLKIVALSVDDNSDVVKEFILLNKPSFSVLWDKHKLSPDKFSIEKYPETFLISPEGILTARFSGARNWGSLTSMNYFLRMMDKK
jgi:thiol-disulfide isomerase/thioredoxin